MTQICDNKSVGMIVERDGKILLIERKKFPFGFAAPAGHVDEDKTFEDSAKRELSEEVGLDTNNIKLLTEGRKNNICRRENGSWHYWKIYKIDSNDEIKRNNDETKQAKFYDKDELLLLANKTEKYLKMEISENDWENSPGLEPVWYEWFKELKLI